MNDLFNTQQYLDIDLFYKIDKTKNGQTFPTVITEEDFTKLKAEEKYKDRVKSIRTQWRMPTWKAANDLLNAATIFNFHKNDMDIDWNKYRDQRLKTYLVDWDAKDGEGNKIPCNDETINSLHQNIALALLKKYDEATKISEEEEQKN